MIAKRNQMVYNISIERGCPLGRTLHEKELGGITDEAYSDGREVLPEGEPPAWRLRRVPGFLPERLQDQLHGGEPVLPAEEGQVSDAKGCSPSCGGLHLFWLEQLRRGGGVKRKFKEAARGDGDMRIC